MSVRDAVTMRWQRILPALLLVLVTLAAYAPVVAGGFIWDDNAHITSNPTLEHLQGLRRIWFEPGATQQYYPLTFTSFWIERHLWGLDARGYHLLNVLLHAVSAVLVWRILHCLRVGWALPAALVFALHPVQVESVAWISERKNILSGVLYFSALLAYLRFDPLGAKPAAADRQWRWYGLSIGLFTAALLSKTVTCTLPAVIVLLVWWKRGRLTWRDSVPLLPLFVMGATLGLFTAWVERVHIGAQGEDWSFSLVERCLIAGRALWFYAGKLLLPINLTFSYARWEIDASEWWQYLFPIAAVSAVVAMWAARSRIGRGPLVAVLIFAGSLFPALGFINVYPMRYSFVADHFQYLASLGLIVLFVELVRRVFELRFVKGQRPATISVAACVLAALLGPLTWSQARVYRDSMTLYGDVVAKNPSSWMAHHNLAREFVTQQKLEAAIDHFEQALALKPDAPEIHVGLGITLGRLGRLDQSVRHLEEAIRLAPDDFVAHTNLGIALASRGDLVQAIDHYAQALAVNPGFSPAHYNLANALYEGNPDQAAHHYLRALESDPDHVLAHYYLAGALSQQGKLDQALHHYHEALQLEPSFVDARYELALVLAKQNQVEPAVEMLRRVLRDAPGHPDARRALQRLIGSDN